MEKVTLCRVSVGGKVFRLIAFFGKGERVAKYYCIMLGRRRWEPCNYPTIDYAFKVLHGIIDGRVMSVLEGGLL